MLDRRQKTKPKTSEVKEMNESLTWRACDDQLKQGRAASKELPR